ncbi:cobalamin B12-binding domain-containing protein [Natranaerobius thermophilus]|uniref:Cobalamin B12-binding domain protein n=1 Tax=Natranaerobius thermophilus (strain ATCC BAA-1301 / DSM 18059 / JW/NM-WN-LF) TaxID=457570 RepID=B2A6W8_NATTJ|nr:cobalamin-dependent protein [Natranaerobius thermophilus]ACB84249.1 cobalamin B12-binding domain protein [Natranaerobius thermophilus JW/NM-WN-LF]
MEKFKKELRRLPDISKESVQEYETQQNAIVNKVMEILDNEKNLKALTNNYPENFLYYNQDNLSKLWLSAIYNNKFELAIPYLCWYYRAYSYGGFSEDFFRLELQAWIAATQELLSSSALKELMPFYQWLTDQQGNLIKLANSQTKSVFKIPAWWKRVETSFFSSLMQGDLDRCLEITKRHVTAKEIIPEFYMNVLRPVMYKIGYYWEMGDINMIHEQHATSIVIKVRHYLYNQYLSSTEKDKGKVVFTTAASDSSQLGMKIVGDLLSLYGWDVKYLENFTDNQSKHTLVNQIKEINPDLIGISFSVSFNLVEVHRLISEIRKSDTLKNNYILIGGRVINEFKDINLASLVNADNQAEGAYQALRKTERWCQNKLSVQETKSTVN